MLMLSRSDMIWTMPVSRCHSQIEAIQMKLRWRKRLFYCLQNDAQQLKLTQRQRSYYAIPIHDPKMGLGLKIVKILSPLGHTPTSGHGTTSRAPLDCIDMSHIHPSIYLTAHWQLHSLLLFHSFTHIRKTSRYLNLLDFTYFIWTTCIYCTFSNSKFT